MDARGRYTRPDGSRFGPEQPVWSYTAPTKTDFYSMLLSSAQRLSNGNTLISSGSNGTLFEVTPAGEVVWKYVNPMKGGYGPPRSQQGSDAFGPRGGGSVFRAFRYGRDFPGLAGKDLTPGNTIEELYPGETYAGTAR